MSNPGGPQVAILMGSQSDWDVMSQAALALKQLEIAYEAKVLSAHRAPRELAAYVEAAEGRGIEVLIAGAGGAAHLPGVVAALTVLPVIGVPVQGPSMMGLDSLLSIAQMPGGIPVATMAVGKAGAKNAGLFAAAIMAGSRPGLRGALKRYRDEQAKAVLAQELPEV